jgi:hypothetical protein
MYVFKFIGQAVRPSISQYTFHREVVSFYCVSQSNVCSPNKTPIHLEFVAYRKVFLFGGLMFC